MTSQKQAFAEGEKFEKIDYKAAPLPLGEYTECTFRLCDFSETDLSGIRFVACEFIGCNLSLVKLGQTAFRGIQFRDCKMMGLHFSNCNDFGLSFGFENCILDHALFYRKKIKNSRFINCQIKEVDFSDCDLSGVVFDQCDLFRATFDNTVLEKTDFRTAYNYSFDPEANRIKKARFSLSGISGLLGKYEIEIEPNT